MQVSVARGNGLCLLGSLVQLNFTIELCLSASQVHTQMQFFFQYIADWLLGQMKLHSRLTISFIHLEATVFINFIIYILFTFASLTHIKSFNFFVLLICMTVALMNLPIEVSVDEAALGRLLGSHFRFCTLLFGVSALLLQLLLLLFQLLFGLLGSRLISRLLTARGSA